MEKKPNFYVPDPNKMTVGDNALLIQSIEDRSKHEICNICNAAPSNHTVCDRRLCCKCNVIEGNPPADWHKGCMEAAQGYGQTTKAPEGGSPAEALTEAIEA